jgi:RNA polymerase sigma-70 factor (ECF subfamily)
MSPADQLDPVQLDDESQAWIDQLSPGSPDRDAAARFEVNNRRAACSHVRGDDHDDLAHQSADDALVAVLRKLDDFRGDARFTTWAYKFAVFEAAAKVRGRAWQGREIPLEPESWALVADGDCTPQQGAEATELIDAVQGAIASDLSPHQREVLVAITLNGVPIDVLADRLHTSRGALYKTLHDARRNLRSALATQGLAAASM